MDLYDPSQLNGLLQTQGQVGGNAAQTGVGYGAGVRDAGRGKQDAFQKLAMLRIMQGGDRSKMAQDIQNQIQQLGIQAKEATPFDYIGAGISGLGAVKGVLDRDSMYKDLGIKRKNVFQQIFG